uniref:Uncharacterized protein n=1 Tax=Tanacetum cinerariifolium TaxID=118510 RepID=A0A6L2KXS9_TANCI|nr:hypothetical protein [Tanacetum cinerariifolium]
MGKIFKTAGLRWIPTGKMFIDCTTKVDSEPLNGSNDDITNPYECDQTLNVSAGTLNLSAELVPQPPSSTPNLSPTKNDWDTVFCPLFDEYFNPPPRAVSPVSAAVAAPRAVDPTGSPSSTTIDQDTATRFSIRGKHVAKKIVVPDNGGIRMVRLDTRSHDPARAGDVSVIQSNMKVLAEVVDAVVVALQHEVLQLPRQST